MSDALSAVCRFVILDIAAQGTAAKTELVLIS